MLEDLTEEWFEELSKEVEIGMAKLLSDLKENYLTKEIEYPSTINILGKKYNYKLEAELYRLFKYVKNEWQKPKEIENIIKKIKSMVWKNPFLHDEEERVEINWSQWEESKLGKLISIAEAKLKFDNKETLSPKELSLLLNVTPNAIRKKIQEDRLDAIKKKRQWYVEHKEYIKLFD